MNWKRFWRMWKAWAGLVEIYPYEERRRVIGFQTGIKTPWFMTELCYRVPQMDTDLFLTAIKVCWGHQPRWNRVPSGDYFKHNHNLFAIWSDELVDQWQGMKKGEI